MVQWVVGSISHGGPIELFFIPATGVTKAIVCSIFLWDGAYKISFAAKQKK